MRLANPHHFSIGGFLLAKASSLPRHSRGFIFTVAQANKNRTSAVFVVVGLIGGL